MIPSDHFVRFYNEVFKALDARGPHALIDYWKELGRLQSLELVELFRAGGIAACAKYWGRIVHEENCNAEAHLTDDYFELVMHQCPSLSKVLDNDAAPFRLYCDHCMAWVEPTTRAAGLFAVADMHTRSEPHCVLRVYKDKALADAYEAQAQLPSRPYTDHLK